MLFWILAIFLSFVAVLLTGRPLLRQPLELPSALDLEKTLYKARLAEIDDELSLGQIGPAEAEAARVEEGRRLLAASSAAGPAASPAKPVATRALLAALAVLVPLAAVAGYVVVGRPMMPDMAIASRTDTDPAKQSIEQLISRAEGQLSNNPDDVRGWKVVAPIYLRLGRLEDAVLAWRNAVRLEPANAESLAALGEALVVAAGGVVNEEARGLFTRSLELRPADAKPRFYLAIALSQLGDLAAAEKSWRELIAGAPADAPWLEVAKVQLDAVLKRAGKPAENAAAPAPGPSKEDMQAAQSMSAAERQQMIAGMVDRLANRLKENPADKEGWLRLVNAYKVMGEKEKALAAVSQARSANSADSAFAAQLAAIESELKQGGTSQ
jgi:cytochrome c-type biogenesis protein CcmH